MSKKENRQQDPKSPVRGIENSTQRCDDGDAARKAREHYFATTGTSKGSKSKSK